MTTQTTNKTKPVVTIRCYPVEAAIWRNESAKGAFHTATFSRSYKDDKDEYHNTDSYSGSQLLQLGHLSNKVYDRIEKLNREARVQPGDEGVDYDIREIVDPATGEVSTEGVSDAPALEQI